MNRASGWAAALRLRWVGIGTLAGVAAFLARTDDPPDLASFAQRGSFLLSGQVAEVYTGSWNQAGPLQLLAARLLLIGSASGHPLFLVELAVDALLLLALYRFGRRFNTPPALELALGLLTVVWVGPAGIWSGHPVEIAIPLLWLASAGAAARGRWLAGGLLLGLSVLIAPWAVLAAPIVFLARGRAAWAAAGVAGAVVVAGFLPFVLSGRFDLFANVWLVADRSLVHLLLPDLVTFTWPLRFVQAAVAVGAGWLIVRWRRGDADGRWAALLVVVLLRILLDPVVLPYYWQPAAVLVIAGAILRSPLRPREAIALAALGYLTFSGAAGVLPIGAALVSLAVVVASLYWRAAAVASLGLGSSPVPPHQGASHDGRRDTHLAGADARTLA